MQRMQEWWYFLLLWPSSLGQFLLVPQNIQQFPATCFFKTHRLRTLLMNQLPSTSQLCFFVWLVVCLVGCLVFLACLLHCLFLSFSEMHLIRQVGPPSPQIPLHQLCCRVPSTQLQLSVCPGPTLHSFPTWLLPLCTRTGHSKTLHLGSGPIKIKLC